MKKLISNKYYVTTIIAIFLSLSIGILIGGTIGQQWINFNQQKIITHYEQKSKELEETNKGLVTANKDITNNYQNIEKELNTLYKKSISNSLRDKEFLFITTPTQNNNLITNAIALAGGKVTEIDQHSQSTDIEKYDGIIMDINNQDISNNNLWLDNYQLPVMYVGNGQEVWLNGFENNGTVFKQLIKIGSYNDNYQFIYYLKNILQEQAKDE
ncbi:MAG: copper transporter [Vulcanibacillus sp.]